MKCVSKLVSTPLLLSLVASQENQLYLGSKTIFANRERRGGTEVSQFFEKLGESHNVTIISISKYLRHGSRLNGGERDEEYGNKTQMDHLCQVADDFGIECRIPTSDNITLPEEDGNFDEFANDDLTNHGWDEHVGHGEKVADLVDKYMNKSEVKLHFETSYKPRCIVSQKAFQCGLCAKNAEERKKCEDNFEENEQRYILLKDVFPESARNVSTKDHYEQIDRDHHDIHEDDKCFMGEAYFEGEIEYKDMCKGQTWICENRQQTRFYKTSIWDQIDDELEKDFLSEYEKVKNSSRMADTLQEIANLTGNKTVTFDQAAALYSLFQTESNLLPEEEVNNGELLWNIWGKNKQLRETFTYLADLEDFASYTNPAAGYATKDVVDNLLDRLKDAAESDDDDDESDDDHDKNSIYVFHSHRKSIDFLQSVLIPLPQKNTNISAESAPDDNSFSISFRTPMAANVAVILYEMDNTKYVVVAQNGRVFQDEEPPLGLKAFEVLIKERLEKFACDTKEFIKKNKRQLSEELSLAAKTIACDKDGGDDSDSDDSEKSDDENSDDESDAEYLDYPDTIIDSDDSEKSDDENSDDESDAEYLDYPDTIIDSDDSEKSDDENSDDESDDAMMLKSSPLPRKRTVPQQPQQP